ncbi:MAG: chloride channel protein [Oscillospiraceae bacterium]
MSEHAINETKTAVKLFRAFAMWLCIAGVIGLAGGLAGALFHTGVELATDFRGTHPWLLWLLPIGGLVIAALYKLTKMETTNTNAIIDSIHFGDNVPLRLVPVILIGTVITHLCGGSAGREGAALQIGGGLGCNIGRLFRLGEKDMRLATLCGMSAVFSALFGTPLTATLFALEVISVGLLYYSGLVPCMAASLAAYGITRLFGIAPTRFVLASPPLGADLLWRVAVLAIVCAVVSSVFCIVMHAAERLAAKKLPNVFVRIVLGGVAVIALTYLVGTTDYNGAGMSVIRTAIEGGTARPFAFFWKLIFTVVTLSCGFKGGEVVPTFCIGATLGCVVGQLLGIPPGFAAAIGLVAVFCGAVNCPIASIMLSIELFGSGALIYFAVACIISYMLSGYFGLYSSQRIMYSKSTAEFINISAR